MTTQSPCAQNGQLLPKPSCCSGCAQGKGCGSLSGQTHSHGALGATPDPATAASATPTWVPWAVVGAALAAGIGVAAFVSRAPKSHAQIAQEEMRKRRSRRYR
jgi:hypothetical protein